MLPKNQNLMVWSSTQCGTTNGDKNVGYSQIKKLNTMSGKSKWRCKGVGAYKISPLIEGLGVGMEDITWEGGLRNKEREQDPRGYNDERGGGRRNE